MTNAHVVIDKYPRPIPEPGFFALPINDKYDGSMTNVHSVNDKCDGSMTNVNLVNDKCDGSTTNVTGQ